MPKTLLGGAVESMTKTRLGWMSGLQRDLSVTNGRFLDAQFPSGQKLFVVFRCVPEVNRLQGRPRDSKL